MGLRELGLPGATPTKTKSSGGLFERAAGDGIEGREGVGCTDADGGTAPAPAGGARWR